MKKILSLGFGIILLFALTTVTCANGLTLAYDYLEVDSCVSGCATGCVTSCATSLLNSALEILPTKTIKFAGTSGVGFDEFEKLMPLGFEMQALFGLGFEANNNCEVIPGLELGLLANNSEHVIFYYAFGTKVNYFPQSVNSKLFFTGGADFCGANGSWNDYLVTSGHMYFRTNLGVGLKLTNNLRFEATYNIFLLGSSNFEDELDGTSFSSKMKNYFSIGLSVGKFSMPQFKTVQTKKDDIQSKNSSENNSQIKESQLEKSETGCAKDCDQDCNNECDECDVEVSVECELD